MLFYFFFFIKLVNLINFYIKKAKKHAEIVIIYHRHRDYLISCYFGKKRLKLRYNTKERRKGLL